MFTLKQLPLHYNILDFYNKLNLRCPDLNVFAQVVLAVPATQEFAERAFSALHLVLTEIRSSLSAGTLNSLLCVVFFYKLELVGLRENFIKGMSKSKFEYQILQTIVFL